MSKQQPVTNWKDVFLWFAVNCSAAFFLSASHNVLYFVSDLHTPVIHFLHHASTTVFMGILFITGFVPKTLLPLNEFAVPVALKWMETMLSSIVHAQNRTGGLYTLRIFDFLFTLTILDYGRKFTGKTVDRPSAKHMIPIALSASLSWLEFGQMEYTYFSLFCSPLLAIVRGFSILAMFRAYHRIRHVQIEQFVLHYCALVTVSLAIPALISFASRDVKVTASWESIDFVLMYLSPLFMGCLQYSEMWLVVVPGPRPFAIFEHTKYFGASIAQWLIQNMAHPDIYAFIGKLMFGASVFRAWTQNFN